MRYTYNLRWFILAGMLAVAPGCMGMLNQPQDVGVVFKHEDDWGFCGFGNHGVPFDFEHCPYAAIHLCVSTHTKKPPATGS